jgi:hypothetical protein
MTPMPPWRAIVIAISLSVTVSMLALTIGMCMPSDLLNGVAVLVSPRDRTAE